MRICWPQWLFIALVIFLGIASMLAGCGKKGPLYLQDTPQDSAEQTVDAATKQTPETQEKEKKKQE